jgi:hypothetical protein
LPKLCGDFVGEIDENSPWAVFTLRAPSASKTLARFIEQ